MEHQMQNRALSFFLIIVAVIVLAGGIYAISRSGGSATNTTTNSSDAEIAYKTGLAKYLAEKGAVMYGAYWCTHCKDQKELFGDAFKYINYVECDPKGENANPDECKAKEVEGFPTWIYQNTKHSGLQALETLDQLVGYTDQSGQGAPSNSIDTITNSPDQNVASNSLETNSSGK